MHPDNDHAFVMKGKLLTVHVFVVEQNKNVW